MIEERKAKPLESKMSEPLFNHIHCQACGKMYNWNKLPLILACSHLMCNECLKNAFDSNITSELPLIEILCLKCARANMTPIQYIVHDRDFEKFSQLNLTIDYGLLSYIYRCFSKEALKSEQPGVHSIIIDPSGNPSANLEIIDGIDGNNLGKATIADLLFPIIEPMPSVPREPSVPISIKEPLKKMPLVNTNRVPIAPPSSGKIYIKYTADDSFMEDINENIPRKDYKGDAEPVFTKLVGPELTKYTCHCCHRLFNKRNLPIRLKCAHTVCEYCIVKYIKKEGKRAIFQCSCGSGLFSIKVDVPPYYPLNFPVRELFPVDKKLLDEIYNKISIDAKKAAWEFSLRKTSHNPLLDSTFCCAYCKRSFVETIPYNLACGHSTCLSCAFKVLVSEKKPLVCCIDGIETKIIMKGEASAASIPNAIAMKEYLLENRKLKEYMNKNYKGLKNEYPLEVVEESPNECPICYCEYNDKDRKKCTVCSRKDPICEGCLSDIISNNLKQTATKCMIEVRCTKCFELTTIPYHGKGCLKLNDCMKFLKEKFPFEASSKV